MGYEKIMKKYWKRIIVVIIVMIYMSMLVSAVIGNIKYREYISVTELGMSETYDYENAGFSARIDAYKCVTPEELVSMYPYTEDSLENKENIENIILVYADINIYDYELYKVATRKGEWTLFWSIEEDNGWRGNTRLELYKSFHQNLQEGEHQYIFPYVITKRAADKKKAPQEWKYKLQINKTPVVYVNLG